MLAPSPHFSSSRYGHNSCPKLEHDFCSTGIPQIQYMQSIYMLGTRYLLSPITFYPFEGSQPLSGPAALFPPFCDPKVKRSLTSRARFLRPLSAIFILPAIDPPRKEKIRGRKNLFILLSHFFPHPGSSSSSSDL